MSADPQFKIAVLISGGGTTLKNLIRVHEQGKLPVEISLVVSSNPDANGNGIANEHGIELVVVDHQDYRGDSSAFSDLIFERCRNANVDLVVMGGFLRKLVIPSDFENRVINIHPSLIPDFCGKGMYGMRVHRAVIEAGVESSGCTVHFVDNEYDHGPIIAQEKVPVVADDRPDDLQARVFAAECDLYPSIIAAIARGTVTIGNAI